MQWLPPAKAAPGKVRSSCLEGAAGSRQALHCYSSGSRAAAAGRKVPAAVSLLQPSMNVTHVTGELMEREAGQAV